MKEDKTVFHKDMTMLTAPPSRLRRIVEEHIVASTIRHTGSVKYAVEIMILSQIFVVVPVMLVDQKKSVIAALQNDHESMLLQAS